MILGIPQGFGVDYDSDSSVESIEEKQPEIITIDSGEYDELHKTCVNDIDYLTHKFHSLLNGQAAEVENLIAQENERIRRQQEHERRVREEEERKRKEEEERKRKLFEKQQEELRKKQEAEKKVKEEQEKERKEREAKEKAADEEKRKARELKEAQEKEKLERKKQLEEQEANKGQALEKQFLEYKKQIKQFKEEIVERVNGDKALKKAMGPVRRSINPKFGQLSTSERQLNDVAQGIISGVNVVKDNELLFNFILNFIAKAIVSQAEAEIVVQPHAALPLARLTAILLNVYPDLHRFLMARLVKKCPFIIGYTCAIDTEEGRLRMGWRRNKSTQKWEEQDKYDERVAGICSLFAVLTQLGTKEFPILMSWTFLARMGNLPSDMVANVHFFCIANWWEACGQFFIRTYKSQGVKLLQLLAFEYTKGRKEPAATRLKLLGEEGIHANMRAFKPMDR